MKTQMKFQKAILLTTLIVAALCFIYAVSFCSGDLNLITTYSRLSVKKIPATGVEFIVEMGPPIGQEAVAKMATYITLINSSVSLKETIQSLNQLMLTMSIIFILAVALAYVMNCATRRKYYITNYIAEGILLAVSIAVAAVLLISVGSVMTQYYALDFEISANMAAEPTLSASKLTALTGNPLIFIIGIVLAVVVLAVAVFNVLNVLWKVKLMKGEEKLLKGEEVA